jgi:protein-S-isoprenylcysteine O-methyltransferase Ste14
MRKSASSHLLVLVQLLSIGMGLTPYAGRQGSAWWLGAAALGVAVGLYTLLHNRLGNFDIYPEPLDRARLVTSGPYRWVRHPMYLSLLLFMLGAAMFNGGLLNELSLLTLLLAVLGKMHKEERYLHLHFDDYGDYAGSARRLIPFLY